jgi:hypothetical protein
MRLLEAYGGPVRHLRTDLCRCGQYYQYDPETASKTYCDDCAAELDAQDRESERDRKAREDAQNLAAIRYLDQHRGIT